MTVTAGLSPRTIIQLPLTRQLAELYAGNRFVPGLFEPSRAWGLCSRMVDVARVDSGAEARAVHGLAAAGEQFPAGDGLFVLRFPASWPALFRASFGGRSTQGAARLGSTLVLPPPFLGTGYTDYPDVPVPEYWMELAEIPIGAELWHLAEDGGAGYEAALAGYAGLHSGWRSFPAARERGLVPGGAGDPPAGGVPRGVFAGFGGGEYPADFGPGTGEVTAYRTAQDGSVLARRVPDTQAESLIHRRTLATWRGVVFEVLARGDESATLAHITGNAQQAAELGLTPAGRHAWRVQVPPAELEDVAEEVRRIGVRPQLGA
jgi:hypothetical protein